MHAAIIKLLRALDQQARKHGGAVYMLNGNHESLNICGDFRYVALFCKYLKLFATITHLCGNHTEQVCDSWSLCGVSSLCWADRV